MWLVTAVRCGIRFLISIVMDGVDFVKVSVDEKCRWATESKHSKTKLLTSFFTRLLGLLLNTKQWLISWYLILYLKCNKQKKRVLNTERNNTYLAEASISPHFTTTCDFDKYTIILNFGGKHHQNLCHPEIKDLRQILDVFLKHITIISWR